MGLEFVPAETWVDDQGAHEIHKFANGWGLSIINEAHGRGVLAEPYGKTALLRAVLNGWEVTTEIASGAVPEHEELSNYFIGDGTGSWEGRAEAAAILAAVESYVEVEIGGDVSEDDE